MVLYVMHVVGCVILWVYVCFVFLSIVYTYRYLYLVMFVFDPSGDHIVVAYSGMGLVMVLYIASVMSFCVYPCC